MLFSVAGSGFWGFLYFLFYSLQQDLGFEDLCFFFSNFCSRIWDLRISIFSVLYETIWDLGFLMLSSIAGSGF